VDPKLEALWNSAARVRDLVLELADGPSSLATSLSSAVELLEGRIDALLHVPKLGFELELLRSRRNADLAEDQVDALRTQVRPASNLLVSYIPPSVACGHPDSITE
jgi:hypothetical protein